MEHLTELQEVGVPVQAWLVLVMAVLAGTGGGGGWTDGGHQDWRSPHLHQALAGAGAPQARLAGEGRQGQAPGLLALLAGQAVLGPTMGGGQGGLGPTMGGKTDFSLELHQTVVRV